MFQNTKHTRKTLIEWVNDHRLLGHETVHFTSADEGQGEFRGMLCLDCNEIYLFDKIIKEPK